MFLYTLIKKWLQKGPVAYFVLDLYLDIPGKLTRRFRGKLTSRLAGEEGQKNAAVAFSNLNKDYIINTCKIAYEHICSREKNILKDDLLAV